MDVIFAILLPLVVTGICFSWNIGWPAINIARHVEGSVASEYPFICKATIFAMSMLLTPITLVIYLVPSYSQITFDAFIVEFSKRADEE